MEVLDFRESAFEESGIEDGTSLTLFCLMFLYPATSGSIRSVCYSAKAELKNFITYYAFIRGKKINAETSGAVLNSFYEPVFLLKIQFLICFQCQRIDKEL